MSSATLPPWLSPWSTGLVYGDRVYKVNERLRPPLERSRHRPRLTIYTYGRGNNAPILSSWSEDGSGAGPGAAAGGAEGGMAAGGGGGKGAGGGVASEAPPAVRWERVPLNHEPWHVDVPVPIQPRPHDRPQRFDVTGHSGMEWELPRARAGAGGAGAGGAGAAEALHAWTGVMRGWAAGAILLALLFVLVRVGEHFLDRKIQSLRRANASTISRLRGSQPPPAQQPNDDACSVELPPPYSACFVPKADEPHAEPPPPYSDCAQLVNKRGSVIFFSRETQRRLVRSPRGVNRPDSPAPAAPAAPARTAPARPPLSARDAASQARLARDLDFLLRDLGINFSDLPPPPLSVLRMHDEYTRLQQQSSPPRSLLLHCELVVAPEPTPRPVPDLDAMNSPPAELEQVALNDPIDAVAPNDAGGESQDDTPNEADEGPDPEVAPTCAAADPLDVHGVATNESVVV